LVAVAALCVELAYSYQQLGVLSWSRYGASFQALFRWNAPGLAAVLWGTRHGLLRYSPIVLLALAGFGLARFRALPWFAWPLLGNALAQIYIISAWVGYEQGDAFGMRMFCESVAVVAVGLALAMRAVPGRGQILLVAAMAAAVCWTTYRLVHYVYGA
jgi:hypothetical protein